MPTAGYGSAALLSRFNLLAGRPNTVPSTDSIDDNTKYMYLADAQQYTLDRISAIDAKVLYGSPQEMTTDDGGLTYTFGQDDDGNDLFPLGRTSIYPSLEAIPGYALTPGWDYLDEGTRIRAVNNTPIAPPLYWYGLTPTEQLSAIVDPVLQPPPIRMLIVIKAVADFAESANVRNGQLSDRMTLRYEREFGVAMTMLRKHFKGGGGMGRLLAPWGAPLGAAFSGSPL